MKKSIVIFFALIGSSLFSQNQEITLDNGTKFLLGNITVDALEREPYATWYQSSYRQYSVDGTLIDLFRKSLGKCTVKLFLGTWCGDSKREVPRFIKILREAQFPMQNLEIVALDGRKEHYKTSPEGLEKEFAVKRVPTFIFLQDNIEMNRIVESPLESLEEDMLRILSGKRYTPNYSVGSQD